jgi:homospermidine synthase
VLSIEAARRLVPHQNATTVQVAIDVTAAVMWMIEHSRECVRMSDDLPHDPHSYISRKTPATI